MRKEDQGYCISFASNSYSIETKGLSAVEEIHANAITRNICQVCYASERTQGGVSLRFAVELGVRCTSFFYVLRRRRNIKKSARRAAALCVYRGSPDAVSDSMQTIRHQSV